MSILDAVKEMRLARNSWRDEPSVVTAVKNAYRGASKMQRQQLRSWFRRVLLGKDK